MMTPVGIKQKLLAEIEKLPEYRLLAVLDFVTFLQWQQGDRSTGSQAQNGPLDPKKDPLLRYIGGVSHGSLTQAIDEELYSL